MTSFVRYAVALMTGLLISSTAMAEKNTLLHVDSTLEPTVHNWGTTLFGGDFFLAGSKNEFFNIYNFTLDSSAAISFYTFVGKGPLSFKPLKMNLFSGTYTNQANMTVANISNLNISGTTSLEPGHTNLYQQSISNGLSFFSGNLEAGSYYLSLSGKPKCDKSFYALSGREVSAVPEPSELGLMLGGLGLIGWTAFRRNRKA